MSFLETSATLRETVRSVPVRAFVAALAKTQRLTASLQTEAPQGETVRSVPVRAFVAALAKIQRLTASLQTEAPQGETVRSVLVRAFVAALAKTQRLTASLQTEAPQGETVRSVPVRAFVAALAKIQRLTASLQTEAPQREPVRSVPVRALAATAPCPRAAGFTLIETALALLAIGLGLMALFGLGRIGLQTTKESENDARCVQMADAVFETLREYNTRIIDQSRTNTLSNSWLQKWQTVWSTPQQIPFPSVANMSMSEDLYLLFNTGKVEPAYVEATLSLTDWNPRYELVAYGSGSSQVAGGMNLINVTLAIYPDGDTYSSAYRLFHTTLSNSGGLP